MASQTVIERLRAGGIVMPKACVAEASRAGLRLELAAALLEKESAGGHNVFGHDRDGSGKYIFPARDGTVKVTKELYLEYRRRRRASGNKAMQGVGPVPADVVLVPGRRRQARRLLEAAGQHARRVPAAGEPRAHARGLGRRAHVQRQRRRRGRVQR